MPSTFLVTTALDPRSALVRGSLRWAVARANLPRNQGSTVAITAAVPGTITLRAGELAIRSNLTIENDSGHPLTIRQGTANSRIFHVFNNPRTAAVTITGQSVAGAIILTGGQVRNSNGGSILVDNPQNLLTLEYVNVVGNSATQVGQPKRGDKGNGGGIYSSGTVTLDHTSVSGNSANGPNSASGHAGGVYTDRGITLTASQVSSNTARNSPGILNVFGTVDVVDGSAVDGNSSYGNSLKTGNLGGGGIGEMAGNVIVSHSQVNNNKAAGMYSAGIVILLGGATVTDNSDVDGNSNTGPGGGIAANFGGAVTVSDGSQVDGNTGAGLGGGIVNFSETFGISVRSASEVVGNTLTNNEDAAVTSGLILVGTTPSVRQAVISGGRGDAMLAAALELFTSACAQRVAIIQQADNAFPSQGAVEVGGGIAEASGGPIVVSGGSSINDNGFASVTASEPANGVGGGIFANLGPITIDGSTISGNSATGDGGGIWNGTSLSISNSVVTNNHVRGLGGGIFNQGAFTKSNTSVVDNTPDDIYTA
jgi:fibronectin-binding autotransporter adhesin